MEDIVQQSRDKEKHLLNQMFINNIVAFMFMQFSNSSDENRQIALQVLSKIREAAVNYHDKGLDEFKKNVEEDESMRFVVKLIPEFSPESKNAAFHESLNDIVREWKKIINLEK